jgi:hypothetical protein
MQAGDDPNAVAKKTFLITMIGVALYAGAVFVFIL